MAIFATGRTKQQAEEKCVRSTTLAQVQRDTITFVIIHISHTMKFINQIGMVTAAAFLLSACSKTSPSAPTYNVPAPTPTVAATVEPPSPQQSAVAPTVPESPWQYGESTDKMKGVTSYHATAVSLNTVNLDFPYAGDQHASLLVTSEAVILYIAKGQVQCSFIPGDDCKILVKFDDAKPADHRWYSIGDDSTSVSTRDKNFRKKLYAAKKVVIRLDIYQNGYQDFEFDVSGLKPIQKSKTV